MCKENTSKSRKFRINYSRNLFARVSYSSTRQKDFLRLSALELRKRWTFDRWVRKCSARVPRSRCQRIIRAVKTSKGLHSIPPWCLRNDKTYLNLEILVPLQYWTGTMGRRFAVTFHDFQNPNAQNTACYTTKSNYTQCPTSYLGWTHSDEPGDNCTQRLTGVLPVPCFDGLLVSTISNVLRKTSCSCSKMFCFNYHPNYLFNTTASGTPPTSPLSPFSLQASTLKFQSKSASKNRQKKFKQRVPDRNFWWGDGLYPKLFASQKFRSGIFWSRIFGLF